VVKAMRPVQRNRSGNVTVEVDSLRMFATIHLHNHHDRIAGSLSIPWDQLHHLADLIDTARGKAKP